jgi:tetratricopeptide (TPR) repeat protein
MRLLAADPERVLNIAGEYIGLGLYRRALDVLSLEYPAVPADESEPGAVLPQNHPLVAYYRGYCREKIGEPVAADDAAAENMSTRYIFPSGALTLEVLRAALRRNPKSATISYLLGTQYFSVGLIDAALESWENARRLNPKLPVLHADIGRVLLKVRNDPTRALAAFEQGTGADPSNVELYFGMDQALTLLGRSAGERVAALERYPDLASMPAELVYELALNRADAVDFGGAQALFRNRFFPRQEGGTNVRQVWIEIKTLHALGLAGGSKCGDALAISRSLEQPVAGLDFTNEGLAPFVHAARTQYLLGEVDAKCGRAEEAQGHWRSASQATGAQEFVWAWRAARKLPDYDESVWTGRSDATLSNLNGRLETMSQKGFWAYAVGLLERELGREQDAHAHLTRAVLLPDRMLSLHLSRIALQGNGMKQAEMMKGTSSR